MNVSRGFQLTSARIRGQGSFAACRRTNDPGLERFADLPVEALYGACSCRPRRRPQTTSRVLRMPLALPFRCRARTSQNDSRLMQGTCYECEAGQNNTRRNNLRV